MRFDLFKVITVTIFAGASVFTTTRLEAQTNLVTNGSFEDGYYLYYGLVIVPGWMADLPEGIASFVVNIDDFDGADEYVFGAGSPGASWGFQLYPDDVVEQQTIPVSSTEEIYNIYFVCKIVADPDLGDDVTIPYDNLQLHFKLAEDDTFPDDYLTVPWDGGEVTGTNVYTPGLAYWLPDGWMFVTVLVTASSSTDINTLSFRSTSNPEADYPFEFYIALDDINVVQRTTAQTSP